MPQQSSSLKDFVVANYIRPKVAFRLKPLLLRRDLHSLQLTPIEHRQLNRLFYGRDLSHRQLSHAIDVLKKVEELHGFHYLTPGYGGRNRKVSSYHLAKHILTEYNAQANGEEGGTSSFQQAREDARHRILEQPAESKGGAQTAHTSLAHKAWDMRTALARPVSIPRMRAPEPFRPASIQLSRPPEQSFRPA
ncbi:hypothetical protein HY627_01925 [Candidatus Uhrbacteria bacterium]|nr:hypothetical protein [Candidatus Uhrbacteria bacterium]